MSSVRLGERALQVGLDDASVAAAIAAKTGLTGLSTIVVDNETAARAARDAVANTGGLGDVQVIAQWHPLPFADATYDVAIVHTAHGRLASMEPDVRGRVLAECHRVLRPGGRLIALDAGAPTGLRALLGAAKTDAPYEAAGGTIAALEAAGFRAVRILGDRQGYRFIEGLKPSA